MLPPDQHISVDGDQKVGDVGTHFDTLAQVGYKHDFVVLSERWAENWRARVAAKLVNAIVNRVEPKYEAIDTIELRVDTHVFVKLLFEVTLPVILYVPDHM